MNKRATESAKAGLRTAIYVRVSTEEQVQEGYSIRAQTDKLKAYALLKDWDIFDIYADGGAIIGQPLKTAQNTRF